MLWGFKKGEGASGKGSWRRRPLNCALKGVNRSLWPRCPSFLEWRPSASPSRLISQLWPSSLPRQAEIWQLWGKLRQEEPQLAGNLEGFLAKMTSRLQEARADKEALELSLRK